MAFVCKAYKNKKIIMYSIYVSTHFNIQNSRIIYVSMYVCIHVFIYVSMYEFMYASMYAFVRVYMYLYIYVCKCNVMEFYVLYYILLLFHFLEACIHTIIIPTRKHIYTFTSKNTTSHKTML